MQEGSFGGLQFCETYFIWAMLSSIFIQHIEVNYCRHLGEGGGGGGEILLNQ
jgi:hypothetical protein